MNIQYIDYEKVPYFSATDKAYVAKNPALAPFYNHDCSLESFGQLIKQKTYSQKSRDILVHELHNQYSLIDASEATKQNIDLLNEATTFTVVTAHQPNLFTGPLYSIYKIISAINLAEQLKASFPAYNFVPVFWSGGEDHDFDEVNHFRLFGKTIRWENHQGGPVGAYNTSSLSEVLETTKSILGDGANAQLLTAKIDQFFGQDCSYSLAYRGFINWLFAAYGLVVLDASAAVFKQQMQAVFKDDLLQHSSQSILQQTSEAMQAAGFKKQAHARTINLFYLSPGRRDRIVKEDKLYKVLDTAIEFSESSLLQELEQYPERFSPNVILRPLFQETILPNLAYIGGGGELAYWLERKAQFEHYKLTMPILVRRCSVLWIDKHSAKRIQKLGLSPEHFLMPIDDLLKQYVKEQHDALDLVSERQQFQAAFQAVLQKIKSVDPALEQSVMAQQAQFEKSLDKLETKMIRSEKRKNETSLAQIRKVKDKLFPDNSLQERKDNFLEYYCLYGPAFIHQLKEHLNPLDTRFILLDTRDSSS